LNYVSTSWAAVTTKTPTIYVEGTFFTVRIFMAAIKHMAASQHLKVETLLSLLLDTYTIWYLSLALWLGLWRLDHDCRWLSAEDAALLRAHLTGKMMHNCVA